MGAVGDFLEFDCPFGGDQFGGISITIVHCLGW